MKGWRTMDDIKAARPPVERLHCGCVAGSPHTTDCPTVLGDIARREKRLKDLDWKCPRCEAWNFAVRSACRICGFDPALVLNEKPMETRDAPPRRSTC